MSSVVIPLGWRCTFYTYVLNRPVLLNDTNGDPSGDNCDPGATAIFVGPGSDDVGCFHDQQHPPALNLILSPDQLIDVDANPPDPPGEDDHRGLCPGSNSLIHTLHSILTLPALNAMANHHFIPHHGIVTFTDSLFAPTRVFGMGISAREGSYSAEYFTVREGVGIVGTPMGLSGTHNQFEADSSVTRGDYNQFNGDNYHLQLSNFKALYDSLPNSPKSDYDAATLFEHSHNRFHQSIAEDDCFFYGPAVGADSDLQFISCLTYSMTSNHSAEHPGGFLQDEVLKSFYAVSTDANGNLIYNPGYRRPSLDPHDVRHALPDLLAMWGRFPELLLIGGNIHAMLLEGDNAACFVLQGVQILVPDALSCLVGLIAGIVSKLVGAVQPILDGLTCPQLTTIDTSLLEQYPGYQHTSRGV
ncbi:hypothetical protein B0H16DRAFT_1466695 [Mycena metata]|uniref:Heme haloperoxidase family profile domain-containing protein n=1 Tax=Mycena metata TaxID=1033252 RepID=A0AAD7I7R0_9AGAR|nr:hypothetical protein B0H16DRAFT_1466695 [Mycena metata]